MQTEKNKKKKEQDGKYKNKKTKLPECNLTMKHVLITCNRKNTYEHNISIEYKQGE